MADDVVIRCAVGVGEMVEMVSGAELGDDMISGLSARLSILRPGERAMVDLAMDLLRSALNAESDPTSQFARHPQDWPPC